MIFGCPNEKCIAREALKEPLKEKMNTYNSFQITCPHCQVTIFPCENCWNLLTLDNTEKGGTGLQNSVGFFSDEDICTYCTVCGFANILLSSLRTSLGMYRTELMHLDYITLRYIQRSINEGLYTEIKGKKLNDLKHLLKERSKESPIEVNVLLTEDRGSKEEKTDENQLLYRKAILERQLRPLLHNEMSQVDHRNMLQSFSIDSHFNTFTDTHLLMLESLYGRDNEELGNMFRKTAEFLEKKNILLELKRTFHFSNLAVRSAELLLLDNNHMRSTKKHYKRSQSSTLGMQDIMHIALDIFQSQCEQERKFWEEQSSEFLQFLCAINQHQYRLLTELHLELKQMNTIGKEPIEQHYTLCDDPFAKSFLKPKDDQQRNRITHLKNKIQLWRTLYQCITTVVL